MKKIKDLRNNEHLKKIRDITESSNESSHFDVILGDLGNVSTNEEVFYHVIITQKSDRSYSEIKLGLSKEKLYSQFIEPYELGNPIIINGKAIPSEDLDRIRITATTENSSRLLSKVEREKARARKKGIVNLFSDEWLAAEKGEDITDEIIKGPPGYRRLENEKEGIKNQEMSYSNKKYGHDVIKRIIYSSYTRGMSYCMAAGILWLGIGSVLEILYFGHAEYSLFYIMITFFIFPLLIGWKTKEIMKSFVFTYTFYSSSHVFLLIRSSIIDFFMFLLIFLPMAFFVGGLAGGAFGDYDLQFSFPFFINKSKPRTMERLKENRKSLNLTQVPRVFLSHSSEDKMFIENLAKKLKADGFDVWYDDWEIHVGDSIVQKINEGIATSDFLIIALSKNSIKSKWVREELNAATIKNVDSKGAFILPILLEQCEIPSLLSDKRYANFSKDPESAYRELVAAIEYYSKRKT